MNDELHPTQEQEEKITRRRAPYKRTLRQRIERAETQLRLERRRRMAAQHPAPAMAAGAPISAASAGAQAASAPIRAAAPAPQAAAPVRTAPAPRVTHRAPARKTPSRLARVQGFIQHARDWVDTAEGSINPLLPLCARLGEKADRAKRRWRHIVKEKQAVNFPESNRRPIQLLLFAWGMLPLLGGLLREKTWKCRKRINAALAHLRAKVEGRKTHPLAFLAVAGGVACVLLFFSFYTVGTTVVYDGEVVAAVPSRIQAMNAFEELETVTASALGDQYTIDESKIQYSPALLRRAEVVDTQALEEDLSAQFGLVTYGYALYVDGQMIGATPYEGALEELLRQLQEDVTTENTISCGFQEDVEVRAEYVPTDSIMNLGYLAETLYSTKAAEVTYAVQKGDTWSQIANSHGMTSTELLALNPGYNINRLSIGEVLTISTAVPYLTLAVTEQERYVEDVPYDVEYVDSAYLYQGDYQVLSPGSYGSADVVANVTYINGEETQRTVLSSVTLVNPVTEQQARGTMVRPTWHPTGTFRWPCSGSVRSRFGYRTSPGGIGSTNHKGLDIANRYGTPIYAADGGTVSYAGWMGGYGYLVQINHGNGYVTYYGHNSSLLVSVGDHVYKGQQIARMGSTGNSTGNHCHFEVRYNGVPKNPYNYLP